MAAQHPQHQPSTMSQRGTRRRKRKIAGTWFERDASEAATELTCPSRKPHDVRERRKKKKNRANGALESTGPQHKDEGAGAGHPGAVPSPGQGGPDGKTPVATGKLVFVQRPCDLDVIKRPKVQLAVWRRKALPSFASALSDPSLEVTSIPCITKMVTPHRAEAKIRKWLLSKDLNAALADKDIGALAADVSELVGVFSSIAETEKVRVRLQCMEDNGCQFWHQDCVDFRLVTTYRGPCTEWVHPKYARTTLRHKTRDSKHAHSLSLRDVALFKGRGETFRGDPLLDHPGIVHRSPRLVGSGIWRMVLTLDVPQTWME